MAAKDDDIDFKKLEKELVAAVEADKKYSRENAAKFRAVEQKVGTYDEFRNIVLASNLQPLDKKDIEGVNTTKPGLNQFCSSKERTINAAKYSTNLSENEASNIQETADSFVKRWKRCSKTNVRRYQQIIELNGQKNDKILSSELVGNLLGEIIVALDECFEEENALIIMESLKCLSMNKRFDLSLQFLNKKEKKAASELIKKLTKTASRSSSEMIKDIKSAFNF